MHKTSRRTSFFNSFLLLSDIIIFSLPCWHFVHIDWGASFFSPRGSNEFFSSSARRKNVCFQREKNLVCQLSGKSRREALCVLLWTWAGVQIFFCPNFCSLSVGFWQRRRLRSQEVEKMSLPWVLLLSSLFHSFYANNCVSGGRFIGFICSERRKRRFSVSLVLSLHNWIMKSWSFHCLHDLPRLLPRPAWPMLDLFPKRTKLRALKLSIGFGVM